MPFIQPNNNSSAFRPTGQANRSQLCRGNDAKCCRQCGQRACTCGEGANLVREDCGCAMNDQEQRCPICGQVNCLCHENQQAAAVNHQNRSGDCECMDTWQNNPRQHKDCDESWKNNSRQRNDCNEGCQNNGAHQRCAKEECGEPCMQSRQYRGGKHCDMMQTAGMVYPAEQNLERMFRTEQALQAGTLFTELYKPMNCADDPATACPTWKQTMTFAAWELRLYLNTHPCDQQALALYRRLKKQLEDVNYATTFDEDDCNANTWNWVSNPWPWEYQACCRDEKEGKR